MPSIRTQLRNRVPSRLHRPARIALRVQRAVAGRRVVLEAGAFDQEWYEAQLGVSFSSIEKACWHYLWTGRRLGMSPHPLFEPSVAMPKTYRTAGVDPLVSNLRGRSQRGVRVHPALPGSWGEKDRKSGLPRWLDWAKKAGPDEPLPSILVGPAQVTWGEFRAGALDAARQCRRGQELRGAPVLTPEAPAFAAHRPRRASKAATPGAVPRVSVIMPTWNRGGMIRRAVESVQAQTLTDWELIIVDDGSDDDTPLVLEGLSEFEPRLRVVVVPHGGVCRARNQGLDAARGEYVAFLDTDNTWTPDFLEQSVEFAASNRLPWVHAALQVESKVTHTRYRAFEGSREQLLHGNYIDMNVLVAERAVLQRIGGFDESLRRAVDYDLILRLSEVSPPRLVPVIGAIYQDNSDDPNRISVAQPMAWNYYVSLKHLMDFDAQRDKPRVAGRVSIVIPVRHTAHDVVDLAAALRGSGKTDVEVIVVFSGPAIHAARAMMVAAVGSPNVTFVYRPTEFGWAASIDLGASFATGEYLVAWRVNCLPNGDWWTGLREALQQPGVGIAQAVSARSDGQISSAGAVFVGHDPFPSPLLAGFPREDAAPLVCSTVPAPYESVIALRADAFWAVGGVDAIFANEFGEVDLALRMLEADLGRTVVTNRSNVTSKSPKSTGFTPNPSASVRLLRQRHSAPAGSAQVWQELHFEQTGRKVAELVAAGETPVEQGARPVVRPVVTESPRLLRWSLDVASSKDDPDMWRFAQNLAAALRDTGHQAHVDSRRARSVAHRDFDDVTLVLRGPEAVPPRPGAVSMMWILSNPESVTATECAAQDRVFAASTPWAEASSKRWGLQVDPLLQCVDPAVFRPVAVDGDADARTAPRLVFVGDSGGILRPSVKCAVDAGLQPQVHGLGWHDLIPEDLIVGDGPAQDDLAELFGSASAVLWDHWGDLRHEGFVSQRVFEVLASGGRLLCDDVAGLAEQFGDAVAVIGSAQGLYRLFASDWRSRWPGSDERLALAERIRTEDSFAARANTLVEAALSISHLGLASR